MLGEQALELSGGEGAGPVAVVAGEFGLAGEGGLVDPAAGDGVGEDVEGGVFAGGGDVGVVVVAASGHGDVDAADVGGAVEDEDGSVDGAALGGVAGLGVGQLDVVLDVVGGEADGAGSSVDGEVAVAVDGVDGPLVAVADHEAAVGVELAVVAAGGDLVADVEPVAAGVEGAASGVDLAGVDASLLGGVVEAGDGVVGGCGEHDGLAALAGGFPGVECGSVHAGGGAAVEPAVEVVDVGHGGVAASGVGGTRRVPSRW